MQRLVLVKYCGKISLFKVVTTNSLIRNLQSNFIFGLNSKASRGVLVFKFRTHAAAAAACEHMHDWWFGNQQGGYVSMGVISEQEHYGPQSTWTGFTELVPNRDILNYYCFAIEKGQLQVCEFSRSLSFCIFVCRALNSFTCRAVAF